MQTLLGLENANRSILPEVTDDKPQDGDEELLDVPSHSLYRTVVGKALHLGHQRPDIQHTVMMLCKKLAAPNQGDLRRVKKLTRYLSGTRDVYQLVLPDEKCPALTVPVDSDWADSHMDRKSCSGGA